MGNNGILYKALTPDNEWVYGVPMGEFMLVELKYVVCDNTDFNTYTPDTVLKKILPETICQYSGKCDMNGNKIFDGDILDWQEDYDDITGYTMMVKGHSVVVYDKESYMWVLKTDNIIQPMNDWDFYNCKIVGNVRSIKGV